MKEEVRRRMVEIPEETFRLIINLLLLLKWVFLVTVSVFIWTGVSLYISKTEMRLADVLTVYLVGIVLILMPLSVMMAGEFGVQSASPASFSFYLLCLMLFVGITDPDNDPILKTFVKERIEDTKMDLNLPGFLQNQEFRYKRFQQTPKIYNPVTDTWYEVKEKTSKTGRRGKNEI